MRLLTFSDKEILGLIPAQAILDYDRAKDVLARVAQKQAEMTREETLQEVGNWLMKHCKGYHAGNHGGQFGHFGIFRAEVDSLMQGRLPE